MPQKINVYLIEDFQIIRDGVKLLLSVDEGIVIVGDGPDSREIISGDKFAIDVVLLDIQLDGMEGRKTLDGFEICELLKQKKPDLKLVVLSAYDGSDQVAHAMRSGASGFVSKKSDAGEIINAIKAVYAGQTYVCKSTTDKLKNLNKFLEGYDGTLKEKHGLFSKREKEVLQLLAKGYSTESIAKKLFITAKTVETHRSNLVAKAEVRNTNQLIAYASSRGLIR